MDQRLSGKVAFITGAARGQGRSHAIRLAEEGADIIAVDLCGQIDTVRYPMSTRADLADTIKAVERLDRRIVATQADVRDTEAMSSALKAGVAALGRVDIVLANGGIFDFSTTADGRISPAAWRDMIDVNLTGVWNTIGPAVPHLKRQGAGSVIVTSSVAGLKAAQNIAHYVAAKHGVVGLMRTLAIELGPHNVRVNAILPTTVRTGMVHNDATYRLFRPELEDPGLEDFAEITHGFHVLPVPWIESADVSSAVVFLASDESRYITGVCLPVDAGHLIK
jgi:(+)-trans-carveol dehydrogenase